MKANMANAATNINFAVNWPEIQAMLISHDAHSPRQQFYPHIKSIAISLNLEAAILETSYSKIGLETILGAASQRNIWVCTCVHISSHFQNGKACCKRT